MVAPLSSAPGPSIVDDAFIERPNRVVPFARLPAALPGPRGLFAGVRNVLSLIGRGEGHLGALHARHGDVFRLALGPDEAVALAHPDHVWRLARNEDGATPSSLLWTYFFLGMVPGDVTDGLLALHGDKHADARKLVQPAFSGPAIAGYVADATAIYERHVDEWLARGRVRFAAASRRMFATVSAKIFMGVDDPARAARLDRATVIGWRGVQALKKRSRLSPTWQRARRSNFYLWSQLRPLLDERRASGGNDLLSRMATVPSPAAWLDDDARMRLFIGIMFGAFDTTSAAVTTMAYLLAAHPEWQERLRDEAAALGAGPPSADALKQLEQQELVWKESLRLFPVASLIHRQSVRAIELGGFTIPAGAWLVGLSGTVGRDARFWTEPERFDPERFSPARAEDKRHKALFLPFGAGMHTCIGAQLATVEARAFWCALLRRARFRLARPYVARHRYTPVGAVSGNVELAVERL